MFLLDGEQIVARLLYPVVNEGARLLEESIAMYERGARLKGHCESRLEAARLRVEKIVVGPQGAERTEPAEFS